MRETAVRRSEQRLPSLPTRLGFPKSVFGERMIAAVDEASFLNAADEAADSDAAAWMDDA